MVPVVKSTSVNAGDIRDAGLIPWSERFPGEGHGTPLQNSWPGEFHGQRFTGLQRDGHDWSNLAQESNKVVARGRTGGRKGMDENRVECKAIHHCILFASLYFVIIYEPCEHLPSQNKDRERKKWNTKIIKKGLCLGCGMLSGGRYRQFSPSVPLHYFIILV